MFYPIHETEFQMYFYESTIHEKPINLLFGAKIEMWHVNFFLGNFLTSQEFIMTTQFINFGLFSPQLIQKIVIIIIIVDSRFYLHAFMIALFILSRITIFHSLMRHFHYLNSISLILSLLFRSLWLLLTEKYSTPTNY